MEKGKKQIILGVIVLLALILIVIIGFSLLKNKNNSNNDDNNVDEVGYKTNNNENVIKDQQIGNFKFTNTSLNYMEGNSVLRVSVTNTSNTVAYLREFSIHVYDQERNEIVTLTGFVGDKVEAGETRFIESSYADDLTDAYSIEYEIVE